jgi:hypothetical protein
LIEVFHELEGIAPEGAGEGDGVRELLGDEVLQVFDEDEEREEEDFGGPEVLAVEFLLEGVGGYVVHGEG